MERRRWAIEVANWCERSLKTACETGEFDQRPYVQNASLIVEALREYGAKEQRSLWVRFWDWAKGRE